MRASGSLGMGLAPMLWDHTIFNQDELDPLLQKISKGQFVPDNWKAPSAIPDVCHCLVLIFIFPIRLSFTYFGNSSFDSSLSEFVYSF